MPIMKFNFSQCLGPTDGIISGCITATVWTHFYRRITRVSAVRGFQCGLGIVYTPWPRLGHSKTRVNIFPNRKLRCFCSVDRTENDPRRSDTYGPLAVLFTLNSVAELCSNHFSNTKIFISMYSRFMCFMIKI